MAVDLGIPGLTRGVPAGSSRRWKRYLARTAVTGRGVAVLMVDRPSSVDIETLRTTAQRLIRASHDRGALTIHRAGMTADGRLYLIVAHPGGRSLRTYLSEVGAPGAVDVVEWERNIRGALAVAHRDGLVHGNISADSILITNRGRALLADMGVATLDRHAGLSDPHATPYADLQRAVDLFARVLTADIGGGAPILPAPHPDGGGVIVPLDGQFEPALPPIEARDELDLGASTASTADEVEAVRYGTADISWLEDLDLTNEHRVVATPLAIAGGDVAEGVVDPEPLVDPEPVDEPIGDDFVLDLRSVPPARITPRPQPIARPLANQSDDANQRHAAESTDDEGPTDELIMVARPASAVAARRGRVVRPRAGVLVAAALLLVAGVGAAAWLLQRGDAGTNTTAVEVAGVQVTPTSAAVTPTAAPQPTPTTAETSAPATAGPIALNFELVLPTALAETGDSTGVAPAKDAAPVATPTAAPATPEPRPTTTPEPQPSATPEPRPTATAVPVLPPPAIGAVIVGPVSDTVNVSFTTNVCVTARYDWLSLDGVASGTYLSDAWPDANAHCWKQHNATLVGGLEPGRIYTLTVVVVDKQGRQASSQVQFSVP